MPWKSEKINIKNTQYDRRVKLTDEQREDIRYMHKEYGLSYNKLAKEFGSPKGAFSLSVILKRRKNAENDSRSCERTEGITTNRRTQNT